MHRAALALSVLGALAACGKGGEKPAPSTSEAPAVVTVADAAPAPMPPPPSVDRLRTVAVQEVPAGVQLEPASDGPLAVVAMLQVTFEGAPIARVMGGRIDPKVIEGQLRWITPLVSFYEAWAKTAPPGPRVVNVAIVPHLGAGVLMDVLGSFDAANQQDFGLVVNGPDGPGVLPVGVPDPDALPDPLGLVLTLDGDRARLWSRSGKAGTADAPALDVARTDADAWPKLRAALADLHARHADPAAAPGARRRIDLAVADAVPVRDLLAAVVAVRQDDRGGALFADVRLVRHAPAAPSGSASATPPAAGSGGRRVPDVAMQEEAARYAALLSASGSDDDGSYSASRPGADLNDQIAAVRGDGGRVAIGGGTRGTGSGGDIGAVAGVGVTGPGPATASGPVGRATVSDKQTEGDSTLTADDVTRKILTAYMAGMKRCYKDVLRVDPSAKGAVALRFTVNETGRAVDARAEGFHDGFDACLTGLVANWRFPVPKDADGEATEEKVQLRFSFVPE